MALLNGRAAIVRVAMAGAVMLAAARPSAAQDLETEVRAVYLYNFARFIEWPAAAFPEPDTPIRICVSASQAFEDALRRAVEDETVNGRRLEAVSSPSSSRWPACHILYVGETRGRALAAARGRALLTVGEHPRFLDEGGMVRFRLIDNRVRFDIHLRTLERSGLRVSARLLKVAASVRQEPLR